MALEARIARLFAMDEDLILCALAKLWFCDRTVWLYEDMAGADPRLREWVA